MLAALVLVGNMLCVRVAHQSAMLRTLNENRSNIPRIEQLEPLTGFDASHTYVRLTPGSRGAVIAAVHARTIQSDIDAWNSLNPAIRGQGLALLAYCLEEDCERQIRQTRNGSSFPILVGAQPNTERVLEAIEAERAVLVTDPTGRVTNRVTGPPKSVQNSREVTQWLNAL